MTSEVVIVGAGIAGLSCSRVLEEAGLSTVILERSRGVGGRCATRRVRGRPVDHGVTFYHGSATEFVDELRAVPGATVLEGWPARKVGNGMPCQASAFRRGEIRLAYAEGTSAYPKHLARGMDIRTATRVVELRLDTGGLHVATDGGSEWVSPTVVLAVATEQARELVAGLAGELPEIASGAGLLGMATSLPCLTVLAGYPREVVAPEWDMTYPERSDILQLVAHDSGKRDGGGPTVLVAQARPRWSRLNLDRSPQAWGDHVKRELGKTFGEWAAHPEWAQAHRWRYARTDRGSELREPLVLRLPGGARLGITGELFSPGGGVQAAWSAGRKLARRLIEETSA
jgi:predicted NAD/FAD-dependent oxidoreductase